MRLRIGHLSVSLRALIAHRWADWLFPRLCPCCGKRLPHNVPPICGSCYLSMPYYHAYEPSAVNRLNGTSVWVDRLDAMFVYQRENATAQAIIAFKFAHNKEVGRYLTRRACHYLDWSGDRFDAIVPVPIHRRKRAERGFNQAEVIAEGLSRYLGVPLFCDAVERVCYQSSQTAFSREDRIRRVRGSFRSTHSTCLPQGARLLVVDDVITTGSTLRNVIEALASYRPRSVSVFTLAVDL